MNSLPMSREIACIGFHYMGLLECYEIPPAINDWPYELVLYVVVS